MQTLTHLATQLGRQREVLARLLDLLRAERTYLLNNDITALDANVEAQAGLLKEQHALSATITEHLRRLAQEIGLAGDPSLARIIEHLPAEVSPRLRHFYRDLLALGETVQQESRVNWHIAQYAIRYMEATMRLIGRAIEEPRPYLAPAQAGAPRAMHLLVDSCA